MMQRSFHLNLMRSYLIKRSKDPSIVVCSGSSVSPSTLCGRSRMSRRNWRFNAIWEYIRSPIATVSPITNRTTRKARNSLKETMSSFFWE